MNREVKLPVLGRVINPVKKRHVELPQEFPSLIEVFPEYQPAMGGLKKGSEIWVIAYLDRGDRSVFQARNCRGQQKELRGVFCISSPDRPGPVALSRATITGIRENIIEVKDLDLLGDTPVLDIKEVKRGE